MRFFEKYTFKRINKDIHPLSLSTDGQRRLVPGNVFHVENARIASSQGGGEESVENVLGNEEWVNANLPTRNNTVIGSYEDIEGHSLIFFVYNDASNHSIHRFFGKTETFEKVLEWQGLNFANKPIRGVGMAGDNLYWTDGDNVPRGINLKQIETSITASIIGLYKPAPKNIATYLLRTSSNIKINKLCYDNFQFSYRYWFKDGSYSTLAPWSKVLFAKKTPDEFLVQDNEVVITADIGDSVIVPYIEEIEFFFRKNQSENTYFLGRVKSPTATINTIEFSNNTIGFQLENAYDKSDQPIPIKSDALAYFKDRLFVTDSLVGLDINEANISAVLSKVTLETNANPGSHNKGNGIYSYGYKLSDGHGRNTLVKKIGELEFDEYVAVSDKAITVNNRQFGRVFLNGSVPSWAEKLQIVATTEKFYKQYLQTTGYILHYQYEDADRPADESISANDFADTGGRVYRRSKPASSIIIDILLPENLPFEPQKGMLIKCLSESTFTETLVIADYFGDRIRVGGQWGTSINYNTINHAQFFEIYELADQNEEELYYEIGESIDVSSGSISVTVDLPGDTTIIDVEKRFVFGLPSALPNYRSEFDDSPSVFIESPSNTLSKNPLAASRVFDIDPGGFGFSLSGGTIYTEDYQKRSVSFGRSFAEQQRNGQDEQPNRISFSDTFIQDSFVNGLSNFDTSNRKSIPRELGPITKLLPIGGNIMLALHERECSSLSIGEGFLKVGDANFILQKTESVVGDERNLLGGYGTIYPESAKSFEGKAFFFDIYKGAIVRYTLNGLFPISYQGMKTYFEEKAKQLLPYKDEINIVAGIDPFHREYVITFPAINDIHAETWGYNFEKNVWTSKYSFIPECYGTLGNRFITFKNGALWEHHRGTIYNNFYGIQYERKIVFYANPDATNTKRLLNAHVLANELATDPEYKVIVVKTQNSQESYIRFKHFEKQEHTFYAQFLKDIHTKVQPGRLALLDGRDVRDKYFEIEISSNLTNKALLHEVTIIMVESEYTI